MTIRERMGKDGKVLHFVEYTENGQRRRESLRLYMKRQAVAALRKSEVQRPVKLKEATEKYLKRCSSGTENRYGKAKSMQQQKQDQRVLSQLVERFGDCMVHDIRASDLRGYIADCGATLNKGGRPVAVATTNRKVAVLTSFFRFCLREEHLSVDPSADLHQKTERNMRTHAVYTPAEIARIRETIIGVPRDIFEVLLGTAMRLTEVLILRRCDYNPLDGMLHLQHTKAQRQQTVPANSQVRGVIERQPTGDAQGYLFVSRKGNRYTADGFRSIFYRVLRKLHIQGRTVHDIRRTAATTMLRAGVSLPAIQKALRHASVGTTIRYAGVDDTQVANALEVLAEIGQTESERRANETGAENETLAVPSGTQASLE